MIFGSFLFGMGQCVSYGQETGCKKFPVRRGSTVFLADRKLVAYSFLFGVMPQCFLPIGNFSTGDFSTSLEMTERLGTMRFMPTGNCFRIVSCPAWFRCVSYQ